MKLKQIEPCEGGYRIIRADGKPHGPVIADHSDAQRTFVALLDAPEPTEPPAKAKEADNGTK